MKSTNIKFFGTVASLLMATFVFAQSDWSSFGDKISADNAITVDEALTQLSDQDSATIKVAGTVASVCKMKGCWMNVYSSQNDKALFVKFKDYGFFVPKDCDGKEIIMEGVAYKEVTSVDELRHYAEDEGKSKDEIAAITQPKEEFKFMATGVLVKE